MIKGLFITDLHFGNGNINPFSLLDHIEFQIIPRLKDVDILIFGGDFFHTLLDLNEKSAICALNAMNMLFKAAIENKCYIRLLRGTFTHDRTQNDLFLECGRKSVMLNGIPLARVFDTVTLERIEPLDLTIAYCPDNVPTRNLTETIKDMMDANACNHADLLVSHCYYRYLLPAFMPHEPSNLVELEKINHRFTLILNGHVHVHKEVMNCVTAGSFERFAHGEEEPKGFILFELSKSGYKTEFVENPFATIFKTVIIDERSQDRVLKRLDKQISNWLKQEIPVNIRLVGSSCDYARTYLATQYPSVRITTKTVIVDETAMEETDLDDIEELPVITEENVADHICMYLNYKLPVERIKELLNG